MQLIEIDELPENEHIEPGYFYFSNKYNVSKHQCCCGCGDVIAIPIQYQFSERQSDDEWIITNKNPLSIAESLKHRNRCKAHYHIKEGKIILYKD